MGIMLSMIWLEFRGRAATTRTRLVQSLVVSDLVIGYVPSIFPREILAELEKSHGVGRFCSGIIGKAFASGDIDLFGFRRYVGDSIMDWLVVRLR